MPGRDGTGPMGAGAATGRGLGFCSGVNAAGLGFGCRRGFVRGYGKGFAVNWASAKTQKEMLQTQKDLLESRLKIVNEQLENI
ncbi:MAG TPA: DUF5320 domain-containing protein [Bacillota bacterium]|nr:DUF5320 domain-containing protein [Clostridiaceae bacterium]HNR03912.1 DUF5320 domain-containing protein [Bacillota bacterium]HNT02799.1 DUF5320 domain-containing protein [Bacillota bacterium]HOH89733.1 DUF5320 domain-containing protein [Bacillota bacterium]HPA54278.1 DUF5320 domain-containing protein [Bacillota bacterium]